MGFLKTLILLIFVLQWQSTLSGLPQKSHSITMADLEVLRQEKNYYEFFSYAREIRPSERDYLWKSMVSEMATAFSKEVISKDLYLSKERALIEDLMEWPSLKSDDLFTYYRSVIGENYFLRCVQDETRKQKCLTEIPLFWKKDEGNPSLGMALAKILLTAQKYLSDQEAWSYLARGLKSQDLGHYCQQEAIRQILYQHIFTLEQKTEGPKELKKFLEEDLSPRCWSFLREDLLKKLESGEKGQRSLAFRLLYLKEKGILTQEREDLFYIRYLLDGPIVGELFNEGWHRVEQLGRQYKRRQILLEGLKKLDPLPGDLFSLPSVERKEVIVEFLFKHIPEYASLYSGACLRFLQGEASFPNGNPTPSCRDFFALRQIERFVSHATVTLFKKMTSQEERKKKA